MTDRIVALIDMDCFYCQVEERLNPLLKGHPVAVIQYNQWKGGGIIAVNYEARDRGVTRHMRGDQAKQHCPEIILASVPTIRDKADLSRYRDAGREVLSVLCRFSDCVQRASVDEAYIDLTKAVEERMKLPCPFSSDRWKSTFVVGYSKTSVNDEDERRNGFKAWLKDSESISNTASLKLAIGALIVEEIRETVLCETTFKCSAGIAHNKILAKLACGLHKPNRQTILPLESVPELYKTLSVKKIKNLGGKFGNDVIENLGCKTMSDLLQFSEKELKTKYDEKNGSWLYNIARGIDNEPVTARLLSKSIGCCKNFPGRTALSKTSDVQHWLSKLSEELSERLLEDEVMNKRRATLLTVSFHLNVNKKVTASSKSMPLTSYEADKIFSMSDLALRKICKLDSTTNIWHPPINNLGLSASKFSNSSNKILNFFKVSENANTNNLTKTIEIEEKSGSFSKEENKLSFFERMLHQDVSNSAKKLNLVPDLSKNDLYIDSEDSQGSVIKKVDGFRETPCEIQTQSIKKQLFSSECDPTGFIPTTQVKTDTTLIEVKSETASAQLKSETASAQLKSETASAQFKSETASAQLKSETASAQSKSETASAQFKSETPPVQQKSEKKFGLPRLSFNKTSATKENTLVNFLNKKSKREECVKLEELFPDISVIDDELLKSLPLSYRTKILQMRESNLKFSKDSSCCNDEKLNSSNSTMVSDKEDIIGSNNVSSGLVKCKECGETVSNYEQHLDMHFAMGLDKELNSGPQILHSISRNLKNVIENKRKVPASGKKNSKAKRVKSIDMFFKK